MTPPSNLTVISNLWIDPDMPDTTTSWSAQHQIPGDLMVEFLGTRDTRELRDRMSLRQYREYCERRFFFQHGESGLAYQ